MDFFLWRLGRKGILGDDPRFKNVMKAWYKLSELQSDSLCAKDDFMRLIQPDMKVIEEALASNNIIPNFE